MTALKIVKSKFKGFTLIELLIVITIIGILATFVVASFTSAQAKARDGRRKSDLDAIKKALELSKGDTSGGSYYPSCAAGTVCLPSALTAAQQLATTYIKAVPADPSVAQSGLGYQYQPSTSSTGLAACAAASLTCIGYSLTACLENANDASRDAIKYTGCTNASYTFSNP